MRIQCTIHNVVLLSNEQQNKNLVPCEMPMVIICMKKYIITKAPLNGPKAVAISLTTPIYIAKQSKKTRRERKRNTEQKITARKTYPKHIKSYFRTHTHAHTYLNLQPTNTFI